MPDAHSTLRTVALLRSGTSLDVLVSKYSLCLRKHPTLPLVQLSYDQKSASFAEEVTRECRGLILECDSWRVVSMPFYKFFNAGEQHAAKDFDWTTARVYEKIDGSMMTLYHHSNAWHVASQKLPAADGDVPGATCTFAQAFWHVWKRRGLKLPTRTDRCYVFELTLKEHSIVVRHEVASLTLLGARDLNSLAELPCEEIGAANGWPSARCYDRLFDSATGPCLKGVKDAAKALDPIRQEGFVAVDKDFRRLKIKSPAYVALHHLQGATILTSNQPEKQRHRLSRHLHFASRQVRIDFGVFGSTSRVESRCACG